MAAFPRPEPGSLQMALMTAAVSAVVFGCLSVAGGCLTLIQAVWALLAGSEPVVTAGLAGF